MKKNGAFIFVISQIVPEIFTIFVLCKLGTDDVIRCDSMEVRKAESREKQRGHLQPRLHSWPGN